MPKINRKKGTMRHRAAALEIKATGEDGTFTGYGSVFGTEDSYNEVVLPGAFAESLKEHASKGTLPAMLWQHNPSDPIGVFTEMREDERGLYCEGQLCIEATMGASAYALLKAGAIRGLSIGYRLSHAPNYDEENDVWQLTAIDLWEVSLVTFPANPDATVDDVKSFDAISSLRDAEQWLRDAGIPAKRATGIVAKIREQVQKRDADEQAIKAANNSAQNLINLLRT